MAKVARIGLGSTCAVMTYRQQRPDYCGILLLVLSCLAIAMTWPVSPGQSSSLFARWPHRRAAGCSDNSRCGPLEVIDLAPCLCQATTCMEKWVFARYDKVRNATKYDVVPISRYDKVSVSRYDKVPVSRYDKVPISG